MYERFTDRAPQPVVASDIERWSAIIANLDKCRVFGDHGSVASFYIGAHYAIRAIFSQGAQVRLDSAHVQKIKRELEPLIATLRNQIKSVLEAIDECDSRNQDL